MPSLDRFIYSLRGSPLPARSPLARSLRERLSQWSRRRLAALALAAAMGLVVGGPARPAGAIPDTTQPAAPPAGFVTRSGAELALDGRPFEAVGANIYYLPYSSPAATEDALASAAAMGFRVVRTWGFIDRGSLDGSVPDSDGGGAKDGVYFQYWDSVAGKPAYNDGPDGLQRLDRLIAAADRHGLKVILVLTNNWRDFGGIDQYVTWYGLPNHDDFYRDPRTRQAYKDWVAHVVARYRGNATVLALELGNEIRCSGSGSKPRSDACTPATTVEWAREMAAHVKALDPQRLVAIGDEGFYNRPGTGDWAYDGAEGTDFDALIALPDVDLATFHLYPDAWGKSEDWAVQWIRDHAAAARRAGKPLLLEEFGERDKGRRDAAYRLWIDTLRASGGAGFLVWMLAGRLDDGSLYPDYDQYTVYYPSSTAMVLASAASRLVPRPVPTGGGPAAAEACAFVLGFRRLHDQIPDTVGDCLENEHLSPDTGETVQRTAGGLLVWRRTDGRIAFTDGYRTWVDGPFGLQQRLNREQFDWEIARQPTDGPLPSVPARRPAAVGSPSGSTPPEAAAYAPNGRWYARQVAPLNRGSIGVFDVATNRQVRVLKVRQHPDGDYGNDLKGLAWSPSSRLLAAMFHHGRGGHISVVDAETGQETGYIPIASWHHTIAFVAEDAIAAGGQTFGLEQREAGVPGGRPRAEVSVPAVR